MHIFPEVGVAETRTAVLRGAEGIPDDEYGFHESYCDELDCDCRRVLITVFARHARKEVATISCGWDKPKFYDRPFPAPDGTTNHKGPYLDPLCPQSDFSKEMLAFFRDVILADEAYVARLRRHYYMVKKLVRQRARGKLRA